MYEGVIEVQGASDTLHGGFVVHSVLPISPLGLLSFRKQTVCLKIQVLTQLAIQPSITDSTLISVWPVERKFRISLGLLQFINIYLGLLRCVRKDYNQSNCMYA